MSTKAFSYHEWTANQADLEAGGRWARTIGTKVVGAGAAYPQLPAGSPWHHDVVPAEPSLGWSVEDQPPVGEPHELAKSEAALGAPIGAVSRLGEPAPGAVGLAPTGSAASSTPPAMTGPSGPVAAPNAAKHGVASFERRRG